jgi:hypothetical protein
MKPEGPQYKLCFPILNYRERYCLLVREACTCASAVASGKQICVVDSVWSQKSTTDWAPMLRQPHSGLASCVKQMTHVFNHPAWLVVFRQAPLAHSRHRVGVIWPDTLVLLVSHFLVLLIPGARKDDKLTCWSLAPLFLLVPV